jgi:hypothetical protein
MNIAIMIIKRLAIFLLLIFVCFGCLEDVTDLPSTEPKLVVYSFLTPGDTIKVTVTKSIPLIYNYPSTAWEDYYPPITDATVTIRNSTSSEATTIPYNIYHSCYMLLPSEFEIEKGQEYVLSVSATGLKPVMGSTIVPTDLPNLQWIRIDTVGGSNDPQLRISGSVMDIPNEDNFYCLSVVIWQGYYDDWYDTTYYYQYATREMFSDFGNDGQEIGFRTQVYGEYWSKMLVFVHSTDENYYKYHKAFYSLSEENPFSEPTPLYTNIQGGLGVFSSYITIPFEYFPNQ